MKIFAATLHHKHGVNLYLGASDEQRTAKLADYCRRAWDATNDHNGENARSCDGLDPILGRVMTDQEVIDYYFADENMGSHEYVEMFDPEDVSKADTEVVAFKVALARADELDPRS
jgi:hypothetical protein